MIPIRNQYAALVIHPLYITWTVDPRVFHATLPMRGWWKVDPRGSPSPLLFRATRSERVDGQGSSFTPLRFTSTKGTRFAVVVMLASAFALEAASYISNQRFANQKYCLVHVYLHADKYQPGDNLHFGTRAGPILGPFTKQIRNKLSERLLSWNASSHHNNT